MRIFKHPILFGGLKHLRQVFWLSIMNILPVPGTLRWIFAKWGGVNFISDNEKKWFYIGSNVRFDRVYPGNIIIHNGVHITHGVVFLTHCLDAQNSDCRIFSGKKIILRLCLGLSLEPIRLFVPT